MLLRRVKKLVLRGGLAGRETGRPGDLGIPCHAADLLPADGLGDWQKAM